jgi:[acyl-carrier-protein] S-malonyltransferase
MQRVRGLAMAAAAVAFDGATSMVALLGANAPTVSAAIAGNAHVSLANDNSPTQVVLSGAAAAVDAAVERLRSSGVARRAVPLRVSAPFHSPIMKPAEDFVRACFLPDSTHLELQALSPEATKLIRDCAPIPLSAATVPVALNYTGKLYSQLTPDAMVEALVANVTGTVLWRNNVQDCSTAFPQVHWVECGPGSTLCGLVRTIVSSASVSTSQYSAVGSSEGMRKLLKQLRV